MVDRKETEEDVVFDDYLKMPIKKLEDAFWDQFGLALKHFKTAIKMDRILTLRKYCAQCEYVKEDDILFQMEWCSTCGKDHVTLGKLDECIMTHVTAHVLKDFIYYLEQGFSKNLPIVYPSFIELLRDMEARLANPSEQSSSGE